ncbi:MAG: DUF4111 domain-containing protein [Anaerolineae bacterium]|nr:DUF4111 domain-containing protein [Anaerolineae bacterium]
MNAPTPYPDINAFMAELLTKIQSILGSHLIAFYLDGSLANGDFDEASDIDFVAVTDEAITDAQFVALHAMHAQLNDTGAHWAVELEGSYLPAFALRRYDPTCDHHPNLERGVGERLKWVNHEASWNTHRYILREKGIVMLGPPPQALIDPVSPDDLRQAMHSALHEWAARLLAQPSLISTAGYQTYIVTTLCRILYTLQHGTIASKKAAMQWAQTALGEEWSDLLARVWQFRLQPNSPLNPDDVRQTLKMIEVVRARSSA